MDGKIIGIEPYIKNEKLNAKVFINHHGKEILSFANFVLDYVLTLSAGDTVEVRKNGDFWNIVAPNEFEPPVFIDSLKEIIKNGLSTVVSTTSGKIKIKRSDILRLAEDYFEYHMSLMKIARKVAVNNEIMDKTILIEYTTETLQPLVTSFRMHFEKNYEIVDE